MQRVKEGHFQQGFVVFGAGHTRGHDAGQHHFVGGFALEAAGKTVAPARAGDTLLAGLQHKVRQALQVVRVGQGGAQRAATAHTHQFPEGGFQCTAGCRCSPGGCCGGLGAGWGVAGQHPLQLVLPAVQRFAFNAQLHQGVAVLDGVQRGHAAAAQDQAAIVVGQTPGATFERGLRQAVDGLAVEFVGATCGVTLGALQAQFIGHTCGAFGTGQGQGAVEGGG